MTSLDTLDTVIEKWSTDDVAASQRVEYWNERNTNVLVGLNSLPFDSAGLRASQANYDLQHFRLADIRGNAHVIERNADLVRQHPKSAVFASFVQRSKGFFYQGRSSQLLEPGDLIIYDTSRPYMIGFNEDMHQFLVDMPRQFFLEHAGEHVLDSPIKIDTRTATAKALLKALAQRSRQLASIGDRSRVNNLRDEIGGLLHTVVSDHLAGGSGSGLSAAYLAAAKTHILGRLTEPELNAAQVAHEVGLSLRHLNRLFATQDTSVAAFIRLARLQRARADLADTALKSFSVADIAYKWGFSSPSHFSRVFRQKFGITPAEARQSG